jgi:hypothetical protein
MQNPRINLSGLVYKMQHAICGTDRKEVEGQGKGNTFITLEKREKQLEITSQQTTTITQTLETKS